MRPATFVEPSGTAYECWKARSTTSVMVDLNSNSDGKPVGNPQTRAQGTGSARVEKPNPHPYPCIPLPVTRTGFETLDNPYSKVQSQDWKKTETGLDQD